MCTAIHIFMIALMVQSSLAVKCFNCDTDSNEGCANMTDKNLVAEECDDNKQIELQAMFDNPDRNFLQRISDAYFHRKKKTDPVQMVCQKLVGIDENEKRSVVRRCQLANVDCNYSYQQMVSPYFKGVQIEACEICDDKDACNSSPSDPVFGVIIGVAVGTVAVFRHLSL